jgi:hypothetical protein
MWLLPHSMIAVDCLRKKHCTVKGGPSVLCHNIPCEAHNGPGDSSIDRVDLSQCIVFNPNCGNRERTVTVKFY